MSSWPCRECKNSPRCIYLTMYANAGIFCPGLERTVNNNTPRKEELLSDVIHSSNDSEAIYSRDYKQTLDDMEMARKDEHGMMHDRIMGMPDASYIDLTRKAIAALAFFRVSPIKIQRVLGIARATFYRMFEKAE
jgi:hypothetical protein